MRLANLLYTITGCLLGLVLGFVLANNSFRFSNSQVASQPLAASESDDPSQTSASSAAAPDVDSSSALSDQELQTAIARADSRPNDVKLQREIGLAVARYALLENRVQVLPEVARVLKRVAEVDSSDAESLNALANVCLAMFQQNADQSLLNEARAAFQKAVRSDKNNADLLVGLGLTHQNALPADYESAIRYYQQALKTNPQNEFALTKLINALVAAKRKQEAAQNLAALKKINPNNAALADLEIQLAQIDSGE